jgi:hypothetical protein
MGKPVTHAPRYYRMDETVAARLVQSFNSRVSGGGPYSLQTFKLEFLADDCGYGENLISVLRKQTKTSANGLADTIRKAEVANVELIAP